MKTNAQGVKIITNFEGFEAEAYSCPAKVWTIGYGSTRQPDGQKVNASCAAITEPTAKKWLQNDLIKFENQLKRLVKIELTENQFSALISLIYNIGGGNFKASTLRAKLNRGDYIGAANEFPKWRRAGGRILKGLVLRRAAEQALFEA